ncbi:MAG TPA: C13 family peptidase [Casimicrobiaceae bacterium]|nr:C13 family peptidase [Casimicrobiaceae bacterium]
MPRLAPLGQALGDFGRNLVAGLRLALGLPVSLLSFRVSVRQFLLVVALGILVGALNDYLRAGPGAVLSPHAIVYEGFDAALFLLMGAILSVAYRQPHLKLALPVIVLASQPALGIANLLLALPGNQLGIAGYWTQVVGFWLLVVWVALIFWRAVAVALVPREARVGWRSLAGGLLLLCSVPLAIWANEPWFYPRPAAPAIATYANPASEDVLAKQPELLYDALTSLEDERPEATDLYFVGFAPYAGEDVFRKDVETARDLFDDRFDTDGRSIALINNPNTMLDTPFATVSNLRATLSEIGDIIDPDQDVVMLYLSSHGTKDHKLTIAFPPLQLEGLSPQMLKEMLDDAGIKWRIIVVSACYSGGFIDPLKDDRSLIITAAAADRTSFGCGTESAATYFGDAMFNHALRFDDSFVRAFEDAKKLIAERERAEKRTPSNPQIFVGRSMEVKLPKLEAELRQRRSGGTI